MTYRNLSINERIVLKSFVERFYRPSSIMAWVLSNKWVMPQRKT